MRTPSIQLSWWLILLGWILVIGGIIEVVDAFFYHHTWPRPWWRGDSLLYWIVRGPATHIGLGSALWALARR